MSDKFFESILTTQFQKEWSVNIDFFGRIYLKTNSCSLAVWFRQTRSSEEDAGKKMPSTSGTSRT